jgi:hypothetical protein
MPKHKSSTTRKMYGLRLDESLMREVKHLAVDEDRPMNDLAEEALRELLKKYQGKKKDPK